MSPTACSRRSRRAAATTTSCCRPPASPTRKRSPDVAPAPKKKAAAKKTVAKKAGTKKAATTKATTASVKPARPGGKVRLDPITDQFGPRLQAELEQVAKSEAKILKALTNRDMSELFLADPAAALRRMGVDLPPILKQRLKDRAPLNDLVG